MGPMIWPIWLFFTFLNREAALGGRNICEWHLGTTFGDEIN
jgi:hypothetical protein